MGEIAPEEQFLPLSTIFYYLMLDFYVKTGIRLSFRDKRLFEITEVEITRVNCSFKIQELEVIKLFSCSTQLSMKIFLLINVKMPTIVGILTFMSRTNSILGLSESETS